MKSTRPSRPPLVAKKFAVRRKAAPTTQADRVSVIVRLTAAERKSLRRIALEGDTTVQELLQRTVKDILRRHEA